MAAELDRIIVVDGDAGPELPIVEGEGSARAVLWPGTGGTLRTLQRIELGAGARTVELRHPGEAVYYVLDGGGEVREPGGGDTQAIGEGSMIHVDPGSSYVFAAGGGGMRLLGGPAPADPDLYASLPDGAG